MTRSSSLLRFGAVLACGALSSVGLAQEPHDEAALAMTTETALSTRVVWVDVPFRIIE